MATESESDTERDHNDTAEHEPCAKCGEPIDPEASVCPECGNNPAKKAKWSTVGLMGVGLLFTVLIPPLGILVFLVGLVARIGMRWTDYPATEYGWG